MAKRKRRADNETADAANGNGTCAEPAAESTANPVIPEPDSEKIYTVEITYPTDPNTGMDRPGADTGLYRKKTLRMNHAEWIEYHRQQDRDFSQVAEELRWELGPPAEAETAAEMAAKEAAKAERAEAEWGAGAAAEAKREAAEAKRAEEEAATKAAKRAAEVREKAQAKEAELAKMQTEAPEESFSPTISARGIIAGLDYAEHLAERGDYAKALACAHFAGRAVERYRSLAFEPAVRTGRANRATLAKNRVAITEAACGTKKERERRNKRLAETMRELGQRRRGLSFAAGSEQVAKDYNRGHQRTISSMTVRRACRANGITRHNWREGA